MIGNTSIDAVAALAHLAVADPYTALEGSSSPLAHLSPLSALTAASATKPWLSQKQAAGPEQLSHQSTASALHLLQQLLASPSNSSTSSTGEVNSRATSITQATAVQVNSQSATLNPVDASADIVSGPGKLSRLQASSCRAVAITDAGSTTTAGALQEDTSDWTIIDDFCRHTVPRSWLRLLLHAWHAVARSHTKWRCIQQVCSFDIPPPQSRGAIVPGFFSYLSNMPLQAASQTCHSNLPVSCFSDLSPTHYNPVALAFCCISQSC